MVRLTYNLESFKIYTIACYLIFNFVNRDISSFFLIVAILLSLIDYKKLLESIKNFRSIYTCVALFSIWILYLGNMSDSPADELDNYLRLLFLLPLLSINFSEKILYKVILIITIFASLHYFYILDFEFNSPFLGTDNRYQGTASNQITYANLLSTIVILALFFLTKNKSMMKTLLLVTSITTLTFLFSETGTRGPLISIFIASIVIVYLTKNIKFSLFILIMFSFIILTPNGLSDRLSSLTNFSESEDDSYNERISYIEYGLESVNDYPIYGVGPHNVESNLSDYLNQRSITVEARDHLHNEYLDISVKFGLPGLLLLLMCYYFFYSSAQGENSKIVLLIIISLTASQLTQSHFAHHQAITFFIVLIYLFITKKYSSLR